MLYFIFRMKSDKVIYYHQGDTKIFCKMNYPNGIILIDSLLFISSVYKKRIEVYHLEGKKTYQIQLDAAPDNLEIDEQKHLWTACHLKFSKFIKHLQDSTVKSPFKIYQIQNPYSQDYQLKEVVINEQANFSAASVAAPLKKWLLVGCVFDGKILVGKRKD